MESVLINEVIESAESYAAERVSLSRIQLVQALDPLIRPVKADRALLRYVFFSMIVNAVNHLNGKGVVNINTEGDSEGAVEVTVSTIGTPSSADEDEIPIGTGGQPTPGRGSTGLPLSVVRDIISGQGGDMSWENDGDGELKFRVAFSGTCGNDLSTPS